MNATDNGGKDTAGVIAPPPLIYLAFLLAGFGADALWPAAVLPQGARYAAGTGAIALGVALGFAASASSAGTTPASSPMSRRRR